MTIVQIAEKVALEHEDEKLALLALRFRATEDSVARRRIGEQLAHDLWENYLTTLTANEVSVVVSAEVGLS